MKKTKLNHKLNFSFKKNINHLEEIYGKNSNVKFRKLLVSRINPKQKRLKTDDNLSKHSLSVSNTFNLSQDNFYEANQQKQENKNIKQFVKEINNKKVPTDHLGNTKKGKSDSEYYLTHQKFSPKKEVKRQAKQDRSINNEQNNFEIGKIDNEVQQIIKSKLYRVSIKNQNHKRNKTQSGYEHEDKHIFKRQLSIKTSKINNIPPQNDSNCQNKLDQLINKVRGFKQSGINSDDIQLAEKKIEIIEKILAEKSVQSQVAKKYYFQYLADKKKVAAKVLHKSVRVQIPVLKKSSKSVDTQSISQSSYKRPLKEDYDRYRYKHQPFKRNPQPFPRSTYHQEYVGYKNLPFTNFSCKSIENTPNGDYDHRVQRSVYSQDFHKMQADRINYKDLDSYKDKYKQLDISYTKIKDKIKLDSKLASIVVLNKKQEPRIIQIKRDSQMENPEVIKTLLTSQNQRQFKGLYSKNSTIKHKNLSNLKYSYKNVVNV